MPYPYESRYLARLLYRTDITDQEILDIVNNIQDWLTQFVQVKEQYNYEWGKPTRAIYLITKNNYSKGLDYKNIVLPESIYFKHETDLMVFKLRWGL